MPDYPERTEPLVEGRNLAQGSLAALVAASGHSEADAAQIIRNLYMAGWTVQRMLFEEVMLDDE
ncbi:MAG: hypothetical protein ACRYHQ_16085 [Janthinobacterium lividum]